jgi:dynein heavy chain 2
MDDNHLLTLPNGERISFGDNVNFIFETNDLRFASPATVSRLGMIFLSEEDVDVKRITNTWVNKQPEANKNKLTLWIEEIFTPCLDWIL